MKMPRKVGTAAKREIQEHYEHEKAVYWEGIRVIYTEYEIVESRLLQEGEKSNVKVAKDNLIDIRI